MIFEAEKKLEKGYQKLLTFESSSGYVNFFNHNSRGYEWFGENPGHEALSAYGVQQFVEMKQVMPKMVSFDMIQRIENWLISKKDGTGGFHLSTKALDTFGRAPVNITK